MISLVCLDRSIGDPYPVAVALPDLPTDTVGYKRLDRERVFDARTKKLPSDAESLFSYPIWSGIDHPSPSPEVRAAGFFRSEKIATLLQQF
jgi:hypothetical protein